MLCNALEWYDFAIYGILAFNISQAFFPKDDPTTSLLAALAVFGVTFVVRPLGALLLGGLGDSRGRKPALLISAAIMAAGTLLIGLIPTYDSIGILSADPPSPGTAAAGPVGGRRVGHCQFISGRMGAAWAARILDKLSLADGGFGERPRKRRGGHPDHLVAAGRHGGLGMAHPIPSWRRSLPGLPLAAQRTGRDAHLCQRQERSPDAAESGAAAYYSIVPDRLRRHHPLDGLLLHVPDLYADLHPLAGPGDSGAIRLVEYGLHCCHHASGPPCRLAFRPPRQAAVHAGVLHSGRAADGACLLADRVWIRLCRDRRDPGFVRRCDCPLFRSGACGRG